MDIAATGIERLDSPSGGKRRVRVVGAAGAADTRLERRLLNDFQRGFPLVQEPFVAVADALGTTEPWVLSRLRRLAGDGVVSRVGAVFRPGAIGASTLAAIAAPEKRLAAIAEVVSAHPEVNHNYEREHRFNLWFVAAARNRERLKALLAQIERETGLAVVSLPLVADYYIDLGFDLDGEHRKAPVRSAAALPSPSPLALGGAALRLVAALQDGLPLTRRPYAALAERAGFSRRSGERDALAQLADWIDRGAIKRLGVIVRHRALGYVANAMAVWDVPDATVDALGRALAAEPAVTLCYRRARARPDWPYNLFCMMHGRDRGAVEDAMSALSARHGLDAHPHAMLFSRRAFKQQGARHLDLARAGHG